MLEFPNCSSLNPEGRRFEIGSSFTWDSEGMRAASVCPHVWEGDLFRGALLEKELIVGSEEEYREGTVKEAKVDVFHQVT